jgi:Ni/Co efflux regulator RcnB
MRKLILIGLIAATALPTMADAQRREIRHDRREIRQDRRELNQDRREIRQDRRDVRQDRRRVAYIAPVRGWAYRPVVRGYQLRSAFWGPRYVVDYRFYRLHAPRGYERWIRYGDDLLLVDIRTGRVIDVIPNRY